MINKEGLGKVMSDHTQRCGTRVDALDSMGRNVLKKSLSTSSPQT